MISFAFVESNECLMCKGVSEEIERLSFGATTTLTLNPFHVCSDVQEISCGKEHVVILNTSGSVFTFGNGRCDISFFLCMLTHF